jgi:hypothetical protein
MPPTTATITQSTRIRKTRGFKLCIASKHLAVIPRPGALLSPSPARENRVDLSTDRADAPDSMSMGRKSLGRDMIAVVWLYHGSGEVGYSWGSETCLSVDHRTRNGRCYQRNSHAIANICLLFTGTSERRYDIYACFNINTRGIIATY